MGFGKPIIVEVLVSTFFSTSFIYLSNSPTLPEISSPSSVFDLSNFPWRSSVSSFWLFKSSFLVSQTLVLKELNSFQILSLVSFTVDSNFASIFLISVLLSNSLFSRVVLRFWIVSSTWSLILILCSLKSCSKLDKAVVTQS